MQKIESCHMFGNFCSKDIVAIQQKHYNIDAKKKWCNTMPNMKMKLVEALQNRSKACVVPKDRAQQVCVVKQIFIEGSIMIS